MRSALWMTVAALTAGAASSAWGLQGDGLVPHAQPDPWPRWQGRLAVGTTQSPLAQEAAGHGGSGLKLAGASLFGDFYFSRSVRGAAGTGFRATSGIFVGSTSPALLSGPPAGVLPGAFSIERRHLGIWGIAPSDAGTDPPATPYVGIGYTGLAKSGWGFSADLGIVALNPGSAVKLGRMFNGQSLDDTLREMRLAPVVRLGVSYSF